MPWETNIYIDVDSEIDRYLEILFASRDGHCGFFYSGNSSDDGIVQYLRRRCSL
jgi:hypothetical protein